MATRKKSSTIVGTGLVCLDLVYRDSEIVGSFAGGTCGNVLAILSYLGWNSYPIARLEADSAGELVEKDLEQWGVDVGLLHTEPTANTPIIIERIGTAGAHTFGFRCPDCRQWLPTYRPVTIRATKGVLDSLPKPDVFFFDRASPAALLLAEEAKAKSALVLFEPASIGDPKHFSQALITADLVKYSHERFDYTDVVDDQASGPTFEIATFGEDGLRFRKRRPSGEMGRWHHHNAISSSDIRDSAGAGDWTTATLLHELSKLEKPASRLTLADVSEALMVAQAAATWSCAFDGPRGGMYATPASSFWREISEVPRHPTSSSLPASEKPPDLCPSCG